VRIADPAAHHRDASSSSSWRCKFSSSAMDETVEWQWDSERRVRSGAVDVALIRLTTNTPSTQPCGIEQQLQLRHRTDVTCVQHDVSMSGELVTAHCTSLEDDEAAVGDRRFVGEAENEEAAVANITPGAKYHNTVEIKKRMHALAARYPGLVKVFDIGRSIEKQAVVKK